VLACCLSACLLPAGHGAPWRDGQPPAADAPTVATVPMRLDHNRMFVEAEVRAKDGTWRRARLWIDSGNPDFMLSAAFARSLGHEVPLAEGAAPPRPLALPALEVRVGGRPLDFAGIAPSVRPGAEPLWKTMPADGNLPSTVLQRYQVVFDYPRLQVEVAAPGGLAHRGVPVPIRVNPKTGIVQAEALVAGEPLALAIDIGASYTFVSSGLLSALASRHTGWPRMEGAAGCANMWGLWPEEERWPVLRVPGLRLGDTKISGVGVVGLPNIFGNDMDLGTWYSRKAADRVVGFLGANAFKGFRVEIDYRGGTVYLERGAADDEHDMDLVDVTLQPDGNPPTGAASDASVPSSRTRWRVLGSRVQGVEAGDILLQVGKRSLSGVTMGAAVDALRGKPGDERVLTLERQGRRITVAARVRRLL
jgi:hypothetical protein